MTYPQPSSDAAVVGGGDFFRFNTELTSPGDVYESVIGSHAITVGPGSDIFHVNVGYFDSQVPGFLNQVKITPDRAFIGSTLARNEAQYAPSGVAGRLLFWPDDMWDPNADDNINLINVLGSNIHLIKPRIEVIQYFDKVPSVTPQRNDRSYYFATLNSPNNIYAPSEAGAIILPYYGRRYGYIRFTNESNNDIDLTIVGINFTRFGTAFNNQSVQLVTLVNGVTITHLGGAGANNKTIIKAETDGMFDAIGISLANSGGTNFVGHTPLNIYFSDHPR